MCKYRDAENLGGRVFSNNNRNSENRKLPRRHETRHAKDCAKRINILSSLGLCHKISQFLVSAAPVFTHTKDFSLMNKEFYMINFFVSWHGIYHIFIWQTELILNWIGRNWLLARGKYLVKNESFLIFNNDNCWLFYLLVNFNVSDLWK